MLASGQLSPERQEKAFETIDRNARSQAQLIEDLLDVSRIISGKLRVEFKRVDLATVVAAAVEAVRPAAEAEPPAHGRRSFAGRGAAVATLRGSK